MPYADKQKNKEQTLKRYYIKKELAEKKEIYERNIKAPAGSEIVCSYCGEKTIKTNYGRVFCNEQHGKNFFKLLVRHGLKEQAIIKMCPAYADVPKTVFRNCYGQEIEQPERFISFIEIGELAFEKAHEVRS